MLRAIVLLNVGQLTYFNLNNPTFAKFAWSCVFCVALMAVFFLSLNQISKNASARRQRLPRRPKR
jgi:hypothetical protein